MADQSTISTSWARIEAWLGKRAKRIAKTLRSPASEQRLLEFERGLKLNLPGEVRESYRVHDGAPESDLLPSSHPEDMGYSLLSLDEISGHLSSAAKWEGWRAAWVPLATNGGGDYQCADLADGRVVEWQRETGVVEVMAPSWAARLAELADGLEQKRYRYDVDSGIIRPAPPDPMKGLREARQLIAREAGSPVPSSPQPLAPEYDEVLRTLDPEQQTFGPASSLRLQALTVLGTPKDARTFFTHFEAKGVKTFNGLTFYPTPDVVEMNAEHWQPDFRPFPLVIATTKDGGRVCFDAVRNDSDPPIVLYPAGFDLRGKTKKQLEKSGTLLARHLLEFMRKLARREISY
jgi:cell wall assembly regulator SMI1